MKALKSLSYTIFFENCLNELVHFLSENAYSKVLVLVDSNTEKYCLPILQEHLGAAFQFDVIEVDAGEENKNIDFCIGIWKMMIDFGADRNTLLINLGGGVVTDMGSFAASTFKRGIDFVQIPTTLLSQVDASVGGKTGIDMDHVKNIIGTFSQPKAVFIDPVFLKTLDERQLYSGFAEMIKHGLIYDRGLFNQLKDLKPYEITSEIIYQSIQIKNEVVMADPFEKGIRKILNFGHTIGHALESYSLENDKNPLLHGEAIAIGFICEAYLSFKQNSLPQNELLEISSLLNLMYPKYSFNEKCFPDLLSIMKNDKKNSLNRINFSLLSSIGHCEIDKFCTDDEIFESLNYYLNS
ncbi:3-dehydroquinate synthase [Daejeonella oryzae]|uniref:3-dehydroquinate synthase n=1 Tax=Daejeonella oryzae TaxID=1122943 RepID=UPI000402457D|nr:3-dehydroquinate synthase [Daejeonella oryzae]